jgi:hypothetical protein
MVQNSAFYTYLWLRENGIPYYVGKGSGRRGFTRYTHNVKCPPKECIVIYPAASEADAFETEIALIWYYGRKDLGFGCLRNLTSGGENPPNRTGLHNSDAHKRKIGRALKGRKFSKETLLKMRNAKLGRKLTQEHKNKIISTLVGNVRTLGRVMSAEEKTMRSMAQKRRRLNVPC